MGFWRVFLRALNDDQWHIFNAYNRMGWNQATGMHKSRRSYHFVSSCSKSIERKKSVRSSSPSCRPSARFLLITYRFKWILTLAESYDCQGVIVENSLRPINSYVDFRTFERGQCFTFGSATAARPLTILVIVCSCREDEVHQE